MYTQTLAPVIPDVLAGFECTMFAYGQTGTGKTHTMEGDLNVEAERGIIPRSAQAIILIIPPPAPALTVVFRSMYVIRIGHSM